MKIEDFVGLVPGFDALGPTEKIRHLAWHLHRHRGQERFVVTDIARCFDELHIQRPKNLRQLVVQRVDKDFLKDSKGLRGEKVFMAAFDTRYGNRVETVTVDQLLLALPAKLPTVAQQDYLSEAILCFRSKAYRAAIVMTWNVTFDHLASVIVDKHLVAFNQALTNTNILGGKQKAVAGRDDFQRWKESEVIEVCRLAPLVSKEVAKILKDGLEKRNSAGHPSGSHFNKLQAEAYISDQINNAMLKIS